MHIKKDQNILLFIKVYLTHVTHVLYLSLKLEHFSAFSAIMTFESMRWW